eukprot:CAMPEP_0117427178 /NCGR_PEP_ID=MMETSP0758-20121206/7091_1 /TAXON_ID=63605 /ORGANISM="Percolomonas cosmopolitus, Strain AE-1 (ATCC 50343)" /LENGTH=94 /DNA_ID=CAMNT_0005212685 /DNA_START=655 /DNA_END=939 /DNA_ORIENTATION=+
MILFILYNYEIDEPVIVATAKEYTIAETAQLVAKAFDFKGKVVFDNSKADGQYKKTVSNEPMLKLYPTIELKALEEGIQETVNWFCENYETSKR